MRQTKSLPLQAELALPESALSAPALTAWAPQAWPVAPGWLPLVQSFLESPAGLRLGQFVSKRLAAGAVVYPTQPFRALALTPPEAVKVVILGQDPYHGPGQAQGLAFSVPAGCKIPPSLRNILAERARDLGSSAGAGPHDSLEAWAREGVLLLNTCLTVEAGQPASHAKQGWEALTTKIVETVAAQRRPTVFMLWGAHAQALAHGVPPQHLVLTANHPSPLSARRPPQPFLGCGHFSAANQWLTAQGQKPILW